MDLCTAGNIPIMNELDCPLIEESHRYEVIPSVSVLHSISILQKILQLHKTSLRANNSNTTCLSNCENMLFL